MTEEEALVRAVCETPDDDTPRLVYADWLDENDKPERAEFIRKQVELFRMPSLPRMVETSDVTIKEDVYEESQNLRNPKHRILMDRWSNIRKATIQLPRRLYSGEDRINPGEILDVSLTRSLPTGQSMIYYGFMVERSYWILNEEYVAVEGSFFPEDPHKEYRSKRKQLTNRTNELLKLHELEWFDPDWPRIGSLSTSGTKWPHKPETKWVPCWAPQWSRGFVSGLSIPQSAFLELREEWANVGPPPSFAKSPITRVIFPDNGPIEDRTWFWRRGNAARGDGVIMMDHHNIHPLLFNRMEGDVLDPLNSHLKFFTTEKRARDALCSAAVAYGYSKAFPEKPRRV